MMSRDTRCTPKQRAKPTSDLERDLPSPQTTQPNGAMAPDDPPKAEAMEEEEEEEMDEATAAAKRRERLEQNRISARESRKRKKNMIEELQRTVITLSRENKELNERNEALRRELVEIGTKNPGAVSRL